MFHPGRRSGGVGSVVLLGLVLALPAGAAQEAAAHGPSWRLLALQILNVAVLGALLVRYAGPPLRDYLLKRSRSIRQGIEGAEKRLRQAETELERIRQRMADFEAEAGRILARGVELAEAERERGRVRAEESAQRIREETRWVANQEIARARQELQAEAGELAAKLARELLRQELTEDDDRRIVAEYVQRIGSSP